MTDFLIKSTIPLFVLLAVYHLLLEKEKMHEFNRFYLLFSLVFSLAIPFITIEVIEEIKKPIMQNSAIQINQGSVVLAEETNYLPIILWGIYGIITFLLSIRFIRNIIKIISRIKLNTRTDYKKAKLVLLKEKVLPHTFLNFIFINEIDFNNQKIEAELFSHELTHVTQKHSFDVLFIEILKTIFWFNPIFIFYKKAIQLNHEFLADEKVVNSYNNIPFYQNLLLSKANENQPFYLASNLNYLLTKKRLIMMTKTTSKKQTLMKKAIVLPILTVLVFLLCTKTVAQVTPEKESTTKKPKPTTGYYDKTTFKIKDKKGNITGEKKYEELTPVEKKTVPTPTARTKEELESIIKKGAPEFIEVDLYDPKNIKVMKGENDIYKLADVSENPNYPGGMEAFHTFVAENYKIPKTQDDVKLKGKVYLTFIIETDGNLSNFKILRDIGSGTGEEAVRVLKLSPKWNPAKINGEVVRTQFSLPISIQSKT